MAIIQKPDALSMLGNMKKFIVSSGSQISFELKEGSTVLLAATYEPGTDGKATIDVKDIIESRLKYNILHTARHEQTEIVKTFTAVIDGVSSSFRVIRAGVANLADTPSNWLRGNFLTWQPQNKKVTYHSPEWLTYYAQEACSIMLKAYFPDNTVQNINLGACEAGKAFTFNLQYAVIAGSLGQNYPTHYDVWAETAGGARLTYIQRYLYSEPFSELEQWFLFENSLGGLDTIRAYGDTDFTGSHEHKLSTVDDISSEYDIDTERTYNKNTGSLDEYERKWLLDYFPAKRKFIYHSATIRSIVVKDSDVKYLASDLPSNYNFTYKFSDAESAVLLNLVRDENIPASITIPNLDAPDFHLPPRLSEYPRVPLHEGVILPAFDPHSEDAKVTTIGAILSALVFEVFQKISAGEGGGELVNVLRSTSSEEASDFSVFSSARTLIEIAKLINDNGSEKFLSKLHSDTASGLITFLAGLTSEQIATLEKGWKTKEFISGLAGIGSMFDALGYGEMRGLRLWDFLEVPELRFNRVNIYTGIRWDTFGGGLIESVEIDRDEFGNELQSGIVTLKLEDGEYGAIATDDFCQGIFHNFGGSNDDINEDQRNGNFRFKGFNTSYFRITEVLDASNKTFRYVLRGLSERWTQQHHPKPQMHFACYANPTNKDRQSSTYTTTEYSVGLHNMTTWEYGEANIYAINGKLDGFQLGETVFQGTGSVIGNGYFYGSIQSIENAPYVLELDHDGDNFLAFGESMTITCRLMKGFEDLTSQVDVWQVTRESGNQTEDTAWNIAHQNFNGQITLTHTKEYSDLGDAISTLFRFVASSGNETTITELTV